MCRRTSVLADSDHVLNMEPDSNPHPLISGIHMGTEPTTSTFSNKEDGGGGGGGEGEVEERRGEEQRVG